MDLAKFIPESNPTVLEIISFIVDFTRNNLFKGFALYSVVFVLLKLFGKTPEWLKKFDKSTCQMIKFLGLLIAFLWFFGSILNYFILPTEEDQLTYLNRLTGPYALTIFSVPIIWVVISILLGKPKWQNSISARIIIALLLFFSVGTLTTFLSYFHRDYLPGSYSFGFYWLQWPKIIIQFLITARVFHALRTIWLSKPNEVTVPIKEDE